MNLQNQSFERCRSFVDSNFVTPPPQKQRKKLAVTLSRQTFSGTHEIGEKLLLLLEKDEEFGEQPWALFDRDLVHKILEDHNLPKAIARYMPEDRDHDFSSIINEILGVHPSLWELFHHTCDTILKLASVGNVILIGRGSHVIARKVPHALHVRIISPIEQRAERAASLLDIPIQEALRKVKQEEQSRAAFVKSHFNESVEDSYGFHMTLNMAQMNPSTAAQVIYTALKHT